MPAHTRPEKKGEAIPEVGGNSLTRSTRTHPVLSTPASLFLPGIPRASSTLGYVLNALWQVRYQQLLNTIADLEGQIKSMERDLVQSASQVRSERHQGVPPLSCRRMRSRTPGNRLTTPVGQGKGPTPAQRAALARASASVGDAARVWEIYVEFCFSACAPLFTPCRCLCWIIEAPPFLKATNSSLTLNS